MNHRRITRTLGAAAGGLLGVAFVPVAVAFADDYTIVPDPTSIQTLTGIYGLENTAPPAVTDSILGQQEFEVLDATTGNVVGTFGANEANSIDGFGESNQELLVTSDGTGTVGTAAGDTPPVGSVFDTYNYGDGTENIYSDLASTTPGADMTSDTVVTPFGNFTIPTSLDAAAGLATGSPATGIGAVALAGGYDLDPVSTEMFTAINGFPPLAVAVQGYQPFDVVDSAGKVAGTVQTDETTTSDLFGIQSQALLVTSDGTGTIGTAAGDLPPVGSVFNTFVFGGGFEAIYSDLTSTTPGGAAAISETILTPFGDFTIPTTFDASAAESPTAFPFDGYDIAPQLGSAEVLTAVNGLPPLDVAVQGYQLFDLDNSSGDALGTFDGDVSTTSSDVYGISTETVLVTSDGTTGTVGTVAGDEPPIGSVFDITNYGDSGFGTVYSDLASTTPGADVISETLVTPFGDFAMPNSFDAAFGLAADMFSVP